MFDSLSDFLDYRSSGSVFKVRRGPSEFIAHFQEMLSWDISEKAKIDHSSIDLSKTKIAGAAPNLVTDPHAILTQDILAQPCQILELGSLDLDFGYRNGHFGCYAIAARGNRQFKFGGSPQTHRVYSHADFIRRGPLKSGFVVKINPSVDKACFLFGSPNSPPLDHSAHIIAEALACINESHNPSSFLYIANLIFAQKDTPPNYSLSYAVELLEDQPHRMSFAFSPDECLVRTLVPTSRSRAAYFLVKRGNIVGYVSRKGQVTICKWMKAND